MKSTKNYTMTFEERLLLEAPLPEDWDENIFTKNVPFHLKAEYAQQLATYLGEGSSRAAFEIPYKGRVTVLKVATGPNGAAQNRVEAAFLSSPRVQKTNIVIPIIDYDKKNTRPDWVHVEKAERISGSYELSKFFDDMLFDFLYDMQKGDSAYVKKMYDEFKHNSNVRNLCNLYRVLGTRIHYSDLQATENWGLYKGRPVIIDLGLSVGVSIAHYNYTRTMNAARLMANKTKSNSTFSVSYDGRY